MPPRIETLTRLAGTSSYREALQPPPSARSTGVPQSQISRSGLPEFLLLLGDLLLWTSIFGVCLAFLNQFGNGSHFPNLSVCVIPLTVSLLTVWLVGGYGRDTDFVSLRFASEFLIAGFCASIFGAGLVALFGSYGYSHQASRLLLLATPFAFTIAALLLRRFLTTKCGLDRQGVRRILVLGTPDEAASLRQALKLVGRNAVVHHLLPSSAKDLAWHLQQPAASPAPEEEKITASQEIGALVIGPSQATLLSGLCPYLVSLHTTRIPVYSWSAFWRQRVRMHDVHDSSTGWLFERDFRLTTSSVYWHIKRLADILFSSLALILTLPIMVLAAVAIRIDSPGPAFFCQQRVGFRGVPFSIYKFRTMRLNSEAAGTTTVPGDSRITRLGRFLRGSRIDEIPQLINVLKGEMSLVGPRPEWTVCVDLYEQQLPYYHLRHLAKPGLTGWAQVNYPYGQDVIDARNKLSFDLYYINNASLVLDCTTILKTLYVLLGRVGGR